MKKCLLITFFLLFNAAFSAKAQTEPNYFVRTKNEGLQSNQIYYLHLAKNGLLYIAHSKGLSQYDGLTYKHFYNKSRPFTEVTNIMETEDGNIFCKAFNGLLFRLGNDDSLVSEKWFGAKTGFLPGASFRHYLINIRNHEIVFYDPRNKKEFIRDIKDMKEVNILANIVFSGYIKEDSNTYSYVFVDSNLQCYKKPTSRFIQGNLHFNNGQTFIAVKKKPDSIYYCQKNIFLRAPKLESNTYVNYICFFDYKFWICTTKGLYYMDALNNTASVRRILKNFNITNVVKTKEGAFILSTLGQGLITIPNFNIERFTNLPTQLSRLTGNKNTLFTQTSTGQTLSINTFTQETQVAVEFPNQLNSGMIIYDTISNTLIVSGANTIFKNQYFNFEMPFIVKDYCYTQEGIILATSAGLYYCSIKNDHPWWLKHKRKVVHPNPFVHALEYFNEPVFSAVYDPKTQKFYFNSYSGMFELTEKDDSPMLLPEPDCVLSDLVLVDHKLLLVTKDKNILEWDGNKYLKAYPNLPNAIFYQCESFENQLWLLASDALYAVSGKKWRKYDNRFGIQFDNVNSMYVNQNQVYVNDGDHIIRFPTTTYDQSPNEGIFYLNRIISTSNKSPIAHQASLSHNNNSLQFDFTLIQYTCGTNFHVAYKINQDELVHLPNTSRQFQLNRLSTGDYAIQFYVVNGSNVLKTGKVFSFSIHPPFYKTWWFSTLLVLLSGTIVLFISRKILFRWKKEAQLVQSKLLLEKELEKSVLSSIKAQMNPHFLFNALNTIQSYIYMNDKQNASIYISKFSDLTRGILDMSNKETICLHEEISTLQLYLELEKMRFEESFTFSIDVEKSINRDTIRIPSMLIQPYVENAIKHGLLHKKTNRKLLIQMTMEKDLLKIIIDDNGIGRTRSEALNAIKKNKHQSFALEANKKRLEILKNHFTDVHYEIVDKYSEFNEPTGTTVIIKLPIHISSL